MLVINDTSLRKAGRQIVNDCSLCLALVFFPIGLGHAEFSLNFRPNTTVTDDKGDSAGYVGEDFLESCGISGYQNTDCEIDSGINYSFQNGAFRQETVVAGDGTTYWHVLVGNDTDGFRQDVYIRMDAQLNFMANEDIADAVQSGNGALSASGGHESSLKGDGDMDRQDARCEQYAGNACDPLRSDANFTGNGTGNPEKVVMHQINEEVDFQLQFLKDGLFNKPLIKQTVVDGDMTLQFRADMRGVDYVTANAPLAVSDNINADHVFVNTLDYSGVPQADFNAALDSEAGELNVTAGRYTFTAGNGWQSDRTYDAGTYSYLEGGFDHTAVPWEDFMDPFQNPCGGSPFC